VITHQPVVVGLIVCRDITRDPSGDFDISRSFTALELLSFPAPAPPFCVYCTLTDGAGQGRLELIVTKLDDPSIYSRPVVRSLAFHDRLQMVECVIRVTRCAFPSAGLYLVTLLLDGEWLAQKSIRVYAMENEP
jgi:hypothetical protein